MKRIMLQGPDIDVDINNENIEILNNEKSFDDFLNPTADKRAGAEIFLYAHGTTEFTELEGDILNLYSSDRSNDNKANNIIARIAYNTEPEEVNIIHVLACHSGDIHNHIKRIEGNIVLLTYSRSDDVAWSSDCKHFYNSRVNNNESIIDYIANNFSSLVRTNTTISFKFDNNIYTHDLREYTNVFKRHELNSSDFNKTLESLFQKLQNFYYDLYNNYHDKDPELLPLYQGEQTLNYTEEMLDSEIQKYLKTRFLNTVLDDNIGLMSYFFLTEWVAYPNLKQEKLPLVIIEKQLTHMLKKMLSTSSFIVNSNHFVKAIETNNPEIINLMFNQRSQDAISDNPAQILNMAIEYNNKDVIEFLVSNVEDEISKMQLEHTLKNNFLSSLKYNLADRVKLLLPFASKLSFASQDLINSGIDIRKIAENHDEEIVKMIFESPNIISLHGYYVNLEMQNGDWKNSVYLKKAAKYTQGFSTLVQEGLIRAWDLQNKFTGMSVSEVAKFGSSELMRLIFKNLSSEQTQDTLSKAVTKSIQFNKDTAELKELLQYPGIKITSENLYEAILTGNKESVALVVNHPSAKIDYWSFIETILRVKNPEIIDLICSHPSSAELVRNYYYKNERHPDKIAKISHYVQEIHEDTINILGNEEF